MQWLVTMRRRLLPLCVTSGPTRRTASPAHSAPRARYLPVPRASALQGDQGSVVGNAAACKLAAAAGENLRAIAQIAEAGSDAALDPAQAPEV